MFSLAEELDAENENICQQLGDDRRWLGDHLYYKWEKVAKWDAFCKNYVE